MVTLRARFPATIVFFKTLLVTTEPALMIAFSPIVMPGNIMTLPPIFAPRLMWIGA